MSGPHVPQSSFRLSCRKPIKPSSRLADLVGLNPATAYLKVVISKFAPRHWKRTAKAGITHEEMIISGFIEPTSMDHHSMPFI